VASVDEFAAFCAELTLDNGRPMLVEDFQREILADYFAGARETLILLPKKNGKTTLLAALALYHLLTVDDAECVVGAASKDQATILFDQARGFVRRTASLQPHVLSKPGYRELRAPEGGGRVRVLAADVDTADGVLPTLALVDELCRHKSAELYGVFRDGLGPRGGQMITISTAGDHEQTPLGQMRAAARQLDRLEQAGKHTYARTGDRSFALHEWSLDDDDDLDDLELVKQANPASWQTLELLRERHDSPSMLSWQWARFAAGVWASAEMWWLRPEEWHDAQLDERLQKGDQVALGFDGSRGGIYGRDATALVACRLEDGLLQPLGIWEAPPDAIEWEPDEEQVGAAVAEAIEKYSVVRGYFDPAAGWQTPINIWAREHGEQLMSFKTNRARMASELERFRADLVAGRIHHTGEETLTRHALNAQVKEGGRYGLTLMKPGSGADEKIDALIASVLAWAAHQDAIAAGEDKRKRPGVLITF
jgi:phage terminase large subunit-like protein